MQQQLYVNKQIYCARWNKVCISKQCLPQTWQCFYTGLWIHHCYTFWAAIYYSCRIEQLCARSIVLRRGSTTTRFPSSTASTCMTLSYPNTSGTLKTVTPISQSSGRLSRVQDLTGETRHAVICAWWKSSAFYQLTNQHFSTRDLSW